MVRDDACKNALGPVAQWLEQATHNRSVVGSIPARPTSRMRGGVSGLLSEEAEDEGQRAVVIEGLFCGDAELRPVGVQSGADKVYLNALSVPPKAPVRNFTHMKREFS